MRKILCFILLVVVFGSWCQMTVSTVLDEIESLQILSDDFYDVGLFPVQRTWNISKEPVEDNTIFFTASIIQTLNELYPLMDYESRKRVDGMRDLAFKNYHKYRSRNNEPTYNFWQTIDPDLPFPHGNKWISNPKMRLPDDLDTSVILAMSSEDEEIKSKLRAKMITYAGRESRNESQLKTLEKYETSKAYEAWFAKEMPQTFDICVLANTMRFVLKESYQLTSYDSATIDLIKRMILEDDYIDRVNDVSHHTTSRALILYHVARLVQVDQDGFFQDIMPVLIKDLITTFNSSEREMEKMLSLISLIRLDDYSIGSIDHVRLRQEFQEFDFFSVKPFLGNPQLSFLNSLVPDISWTCEAYNWTLYLEYLYLNRTYLSKLSSSR